MTKEEISLYAKKYHRAQIILLVIVILLVVSVAAALIIVGTIMLLGDQEVLTIITAVVLFLIAAFDIYGGIRFVIFAVRKIKYTKDIECARNYCRLHGIVPSQNKKEEE